MTVSLLNLPLDLQSWLIQTAAVAASQLRTNTRTEDMDCLNRLCFWWLMGVSAATLVGCGNEVAGASEGGGPSSTSATTSVGGQGGQGGQGGGDGVEPFRIALSVSPFTGVLFEAGAQYSDGSLVATDASSLEALYIAHGANELFARISTERQKTAAPDDHSLDTAKARAELAKVLGLPFNPELGLWAHYGDIGCEPAPDFSEFPNIVLPGPWATLTTEEMTPALYDYAAAVATEILSTGVTVNYWDLGNEIDLGVAGIAPEGFNCTTPYVAPDGVDPEIGKKTVLGLLTEPEESRISWLGAHVWPHEAKLLVAVAEGIRSVDPGAKFATHISQSLSTTFGLAFYQAMADGGFTPDRIGFSYYPSATDSQGRVKKFRDTLAAVQDHFGRPAYIAEVAYPAGPIPEGPYSTWTYDIPKYPIGEDGQAAFFRDLTSWSVAAGLAGIRPWAPEVFVPGWKGFALFDADKGSPALARKAIAALAEGAQTPDSGAFADQ